MPTPPALPPGHGEALTKAEAKMIEAAQRVAAHRSGAGGGVAYYMRDEQGPFLNGWRPALRDAQDVVRAGYTIAAARATDAIHNSGWLAGGITQAISAIMGPGLRLNARPDTTVIKFDGLKDDSGRPIDANGWARFTERRWEAYSSTPRECDAVGRQTIHAMCKAALKQWFRTGEIVAILPYRRRPGETSPCKVLLMQSHRLSQQTNTLERIVQGVRMDDDGRPAAYRFEFRAPLTGGIEVKEVLALDSAGRPQVVHAFEGGPGEVRGISPLAPVLQVTRQYDQLSNATLTAALIQTIFAATVESEYPTADFLQSLKGGAEQQGLGAGRIADMLEAMTAWSTQTTFDLKQAGKINHLFPGEKMKFNRSEHPNGNYEQFAKFLLREMARCLGLTYEQFTGDYSGATYSSVRMATSDGHQVTLDRRKNVAGPFMQGVYEAWLEDEIESGRIKFPGGLAGFLAHRSAACRADWRGPPKPQADDLKTANAARLYKQMGIMPDELIAADLGLDIEDVYEALAREAALRKKLGIDVVLAPALAGVPGSSPLLLIDPNMPRDEGAGTPPKPPKAPPGGAALSDLPELEDSE